MKAAPHKLKILHLEDQPSDADQIAWILRKAQVDCELTVVDNRNEFKNALTRFEPEIIISDHSLPSFNSIEALSLLKESGLKIPFILVTGMVSEEFAVEAMRSGADDYILKDRLQRLPNAVINAMEKFRLEREQRKTETLLRNIDANSLDMICSVSEDGRFIHVSAASETILGYRPDELIDKYLHEYVHPEDMQKTKLASERIMQGQNSTNFENRYIRKDGSIVHLSWSARWDATDRIRYGTARDATEKKNAEKTIATERKRLSDLFMNAPVSMCILKGKDHVFELANPVYLQTSGRHDIVGKSGKEVFPELESQGIFKLLDHIYETGEPLYLNEMAMKIDREGNGQLTEIYQNILRQPYRDVEGNVAGIFYFGVDVTDQVRARQKIEESKKQYAHLVQNLPSAVYTCDANGRILLYNKAAVELWGREPELGKDVWCGSWKIYDKEGNDLPLVQCPMARAMKEGRSIFGEEIIIERPDGTRRNVNPYPSPTLDEAGNVMGAINMLIDITDQRKIEVENKKLGFVASLTVNAVIVTDADGRITWVNNGFERITEYSFAEVLGKKPGDFLQGAETNRATKEHMHTCNQQDLGFRVEVINYSKSGRKYWLDIEVVPLHDQQGKLTGFMAIEMDITSRKKAEQEKLDMISSLEIKNKDLQQFSYIVSHNLRAPIAKILGLTNIMGADPVENYSLTQLISGEASNLDEVVKDINTIVSARRSDQEKKERVVFERKLNLITQVLEKEIAESGASIISNFSEVKEIDTIKSYFYSILYNLISNAIKYRQPDVPLRIEIQTTQDEKFICLMVKDNGMGIDLDKNGSKIFGLYRRFHGNAIPGKGMGLNLVKAHAESLGGHVDVESKLKEGTVFKVYILKDHGKDTSK